MNYQKTLKLNAIIHVIGILVSLYLIYHHYAYQFGGDTQSFCSISGKVDCDVVNTSRFSEFLGIPLSVYALTYHLMAIIVSIFAMNSMYVAKDVLLLLTTLGGFTVFTSVLLFIISLTQLKTLCIMCMSLYAVDIATFFTALIAWKKAQFPNPFFQELKLINRKRIGQYFGSALGILIVFHLASAGMLSQEPDIPFDKATFIAEFQSNPVKNVVPGDSARLGDPNAKLTIVEFADFQCPHCATASKIIHRLLKTNAGKFQLVFKNYPFDQACNPEVKHRMHDFACEAARGSICARKFNQFEKYYDIVFKKQTEINSAFIKNTLLSLGATESQYEECMNSAQVREELRLDLEHGNQLGIEGTPTFFANGKKVMGMIDEKRLKTILKELNLD